MDRKRITNIEVYIDYYGIVVIIQRLTFDQINKSY